MRATTISHRTTIHLKIQVISSMEGLALELRPSRCHLLKELGKSIPRDGSMSKGPEVGMSLTCLRNNVLVHGDKGKNGM